MSEHSEMYKELQGFAQKAKEKALTIDDVLAFSIMSEDKYVNETKISFKKIVNVKEYESETYEQSVTIKIPNDIKGIELMLLTVIVQAQLMYTIIISMTFKAQMDTSAFTDEKTKIEAELNTVATKYLSIMDS